MYIYTHIHTLPLRLKFCLCRRPQKKANLRQAPKSPAPIHDNFLSTKRRTNFILGYFAIEFYPYEEGVPGILLKSLKSAFYSRFLLIRIFDKPFLDSQSLEG